MRVSKATNDDLTQINELVENLDNKDTIYQGIYEATINPDSPNMAFCTKVGNDVVASFLISKNVNLPYYKSHFHI